MDAGKMPRIDSFSYKVELLNPSVASTQIFLAVELVAWMEEEDLLLWIQDWVHYIPAQMSLVLMLRKAAGESRFLIDAPGIHFSGKEEITAGVSFLIFAFGWQGWILGRSMRSALVIGDGITTIFVNTKEMQEKLLNILSRFNLDAKFFGPARDPS